MTTVLLIIHLMIAVTLVGVVLLQRSDGGALGIGGGGGGMMTGRGVGNALTRATAVLAAAFFVTSLALGILEAHKHNAGSVIDQITPDSSTTAPSGAIPGPASTNAITVPPPATTAPATPAEPIVPRAQ